MGLSRTRRERPGRIKDEVRLLTLNGNIKRREAMYKVRNQIANPAEEQAPEDEEITPTGANPGTRTIPAGSLEQMLPNQLPQLLPIPTATTTTVTNTLSVQQQSTAATSAQQSLTSTQTVAAVPRGQPATIPVRVITDPCHEPGPQRISDYVPRHLT